MTADLIERSISNTYKPVWAPLTVYNRICPECMERYQDGARSTWVDIAVCPECTAWAKGKAELERVKKMVYWCTRPHVTEKRKARAVALQAQLKKLEAKYGGTKYDRRRRA